MELGKSIKTTVEKLAAFIKWVARPEKLPASEADAGGSKTAPSWWRPLLLPEVPPRDDTRNPAPAGGFFRSIFEFETLPRDEQVPKAHARPGFIKTLIGFEALTRDETSTARPPSLLRRLAGREKLEAEKVEARQGRSNDDKEN